MNITTTTTIGVATTTIQDYQLCDMGDETQELFDKIITPQYFYPELVYYDLFGEMIPWMRPDDYEERKKDKSWLFCLYGERPNEYNGIIFQGKYLRTNNGELIGWIYWSLNKKNVHLRYIVLVEEYQKKGLGKKLMEWFIRTCIDNGKKDISLSFNYYVDGLKELYGGFGFRNWNGNCNPPSSSFTTWYRKSRATKRLYNKVKTF